MALRQVTALEGRLKGSNRLEIRLGIIKLASIAALDAKRIHKRS
jgi:hypothetical protein